MRFQADWPPDSGVLETGHHAIRSRQPVRASTGKDDGVNSVDRCRRIQQVGLSSSRATAAYVHPTYCAAPSHDNGRPSQPAIAIRRVMADLKPLDHSLILPTCRRQTAKRVPVKDPASVALRVRVW